MVRPHLSLSVLTRTNSAKFVLCFLPHVCRMGNKTGHWHPSGHHLFIFGSLHSRLVRVHSTQSSVVPYTTGVRTNCPLILVRTIVTISPNCYLQPLWCLTWVLQALMPPFPSKPS